MKKFILGALCLFFFASAMECKKTDPTPIPVEKITIKPPASLPTSLTPGSTVQFTVDIQPPTAANKKVSWSSSDTKLATVDPTGKVTILENPKGGTVIITAVSNDGAKKATCTITVKAAVVPVTGITNLPTAATVGVELTLSGTIMPADATNQTITWSSTEAGVTITGGNKFKATSTGAKKVTATVVNGVSATTNYTQTFTITVTAASVALSFTGPFSIPASTVGTAITAVSVSGGVSGGTPPYTFTTTAPGLLPAGITIDNNTGIISGKPTAVTAAGEATITVTDNASPKASKSIKVPYGAITAPTVPVITINTQPANATINKGGTTKLSVTASVTDGATLTYQWYRNTSNSYTGATSLGSTARAATYDTPASLAGGKYYYFCEVGATGGATPVRSSIATVTVFVPVTNITGVTTTAKVGTPLTLTGTVAPTDATNKTIEWSVISAGTTNATITGSALNTFNATAAGTATVRATIINGTSPSSNYTKTFTITVSNPVTGVKIDSELSGTTQIYDVLYTDIVLACNVLPSTATNRNVTWNSSNTAVATVSSDIVTESELIKITFVGVGTTVIKVTTQEEGFEDSFTLKLANLVLGNSGSITESAREHSNVTLSWGLADLGGYSDFYYSLYQCTETPITFDSLGFPKNATLVAGGWNMNSYTVTSLNSTKDYYFTVVVQSGFIRTAHYQEKAVLSIPSLGGTVTITGTARFDGTLTANTSGLTPSSNLGTLSYQWRRGTTNISGATNATYTPVKADIGQTLNVQVTAANCTGKVTSSSTATVVAFEGNGNVSTPYKIQTTPQLELLAQYVNAGNTTYRGAYYDQIGNLSVSGNWTPIGTGSNPFLGSYNGGGYNLMGIYFSRSDDVTGLFGTVRGTIHHVKLVSVTISGTNYVGGIAGVLNGGTIHHCSVTVTFISGTGNSVGGIAGAIKSMGEIYSCTVSGFEGGINGVNYVGGIAGSINTGSVSNCYIMTSVTGNYAVGGIVGSNESGDIDHCYATGNAASSGDAVGGIAGYHYDGTIKYCVALNQSIRTTSGSSDKIGRVVGHGASGLGNNYARTAGDMLKVGASYITPPSPGSGTSPNGQDVSATNYNGSNSDTWWGLPIGSGPFFSTGAWSFAKNATPTLRGF